MKDTRKRTSTSKGKHRVEDRPDSASSTNLLSSPSTSAHASTGRRELPPHVNDRREGRLRSSSASQAVTAQLDWAGSAEDEVDCMSPAYPCLDYGSSSSTLLSARPVSQSTSSTRTSCDSTEDRLSPGHPRNKRRPRASMVESVSTEETFVDQDGNNGEIDSKVDFEANDSEVEFEVKDDEDGDSEDDSDDDSDSDEGSSKGGDEAGGPRDHWDTDDEDEYGGQGGGGTDQNPGNDDDDGRGGADSDGGDEGERMEQAASKTLTILHGHQDDEDPQYPDVDQDFGDNNDPPNDSADGGNSSSDDDDDGRSDLGGAGRAISCCAEPDSDTVAQSPQDANISREVDEFDIQRHFKGCITRSTIIDAIVVSSMLVVL